MNRTLTTTVMFLCLAMLAPQTKGQISHDSYISEFMPHFERSMRKMISLAEAVPEEKYEWSPNDETMTIATVYMHIARYNYYYPETAMGIAAPRDVNLSTMESISDKETVIEHLKRSRDHVRNIVESMTEEDFVRDTRLYGRDTKHWGVLLQLLSHMNEHVGQSVAYARMNGVVPPWSR